MGRGNCICLWSALLPHWQLLKRWLLPKISVRLHVDKISHDFRVFRYSGRNFHSRGENSFRFLINGGEGTRGRALRQSGTKGFPGASNYSQLRGLCIILAVTAESSLPREIYKSAIMKLRELKCHDLFSLVLIIFSEKKTFHTRENSTSLLSIPGKKSFFFIVHIFKAIR